MNNKENNSSNLNDTDELYHLPLEAYFNDDIFKQEKELIFTHNPKYITHESVVPQIGDFCVLEKEENARFIIRTDQNNINLLSNICRHRQALILTGSGNNAQNIVCPIHLWTYDTHGKLLNAAQFNPKPCLNLEKYPIYTSHGLIFEDYNYDYNNKNNISNPKNRINSDLEKIFSHHELLKNIQLEKYIFNARQVHTCNYNWKTFMEVYAENYHVNAFHAGLSNFVDCNNIDFYFDTCYSIQSSPIKNFLQSSGSENYKKWQNQVLHFANGEGNLPPYGAIWLEYYPNIMLEFYPYTLVISTLYPESPSTTKNVIEFYYHEEIALFEEEFMATHQASYVETCAEDDEIALRIESGRKALYKAGKVQYGPYHQPLEQGLQHFQAWYKQQMMI